MPPEPLPDDAALDDAVTEDGGDEAQAVGFEWTREPTVDIIPPGPISGEMNGEPFGAKSVRLEKADEGRFELTISNTAVEGDDPTASISGDDAWELTFTATEGETGEWTWTIAEEKNYEEEHVYYWYQQPNNEGPMSINDDWGGALQIDEWSVEEADPEADTFSTLLGNVTGKVALVMDDDEKSWCAGEFDAVYYEW